MKHSIYYQNQIAQLLKQSIISAIQMDRTVLFFITYCKHRSPETDAARAAPAFDNNDIVEIAKAIAHYERFRIFNQKTSGFLPG